MKEVSQGLNFLSLRRLFHPIGSLLRVRVPFTRETESKNILSAQNAGLKVRKICDLGL